MPLTERGLEVVIPSKNNRKHPYDYARVLYQAGHLVENFFAKLKQYRAIATRFDLRSQNFLDGIYLAASVIWLA
jgi:transposase